ncbi:hypothetical protein BH23ACT10_BH23ACT10_02840 [soil metagenome]
MTAATSTAGRYRQLIAGGVLLLAACTPAATPDRPAAAPTTASPAVAGIAPGEERSFPPAPDIATGPLADGTVELLDTVFGSVESTVNTDAIRDLGATGDARVTWLLGDLLRFLPSGPNHDAAVAAFEQLTDTTVDDGDPWTVVTDRLIAWDLPAPPGYVGWKRQLYEVVEPGWEPFFADADADIDWRLVSWGGVPIDDRPLAAIELPCPEGCIPALDDPAVTDADGGSWYPDHFVVFGVEVGGEARAYPKNIMEVHEMVNDTVGGRRIAMPYCTLCGSAQAYLTDDVATSVDLDGTGSYELRTTGLLSRSNKVMYEFHTKSVFDTFTGEALSGPLHDAGVELEQISVVTSRWGDWKRTHPDTTILAEDGGIGRDYPEDPLRGRDDGGPIFPIGDVDPRLPVQEQVVGVVSPDGTAVAFPAEAARTALDAGDDVTVGGVRLQVAAGGLNATLADGTPVASHQAFWFAWSQFHPDTRLWTSALGS